MSRSRCRRAARKGLCSVSLVCTVAFTGAALGEEATKDFAGLEEVMVTARRSAESAQSVPISITTITERELIDLNVRDLVDVQRISPGLFISSAQIGGRAKLTIRGQAEVDDKLTADGSVGVYINGASFGGSQYGLRASLIDIERVEVLKGPQGTLFGKNTTGGAINITTQQPTYEWGGYVDALYGSNENLQSQLAINAPLIQDKLAIRAAGQVISRDGFYHDVKGRDSNNDASLTGRLLLRADPTPELNILLSADAVRIRNEDVRFVPTFDSMQAAPASTLGAVAAQLGLNPSSAADRLTAYDAWRGYFDAYQRDPRRQDGFNDAWRPHDDLDHYGFSANVAYDVGGVTLRSISAYRRLTRDLDADLDGTPFVLLDQRQATRSKYYSQEIQLSAIDGVALDWQFGGFFDRKTGTDITMADSLAHINRNRASIVESDVDNRSWAAYVQGVYNLSPAVRVTAGARYTQDRREMVSHNRTDTALAIDPILGGGVSRCGLLSPALGGPVFPDCSYGASETFDKTTWLISADWRPVEAMMVYGSISTGYRTGGFTPPGNDVLASQAALDAAFTPYEPETVTNYELGFKSDLLNRHLRVNGSMFYADYEDIQQRIRDFVNGIAINLIRNAAAATLYGGEFEIDAQPTEGLTLSASAAYLHARFDEFFARDTAGNLLDLSAQPFPAPEWTYSLSGTYELPVRGGSVRFNTNYAWTDDVNHAPGTPNAASVSQPSYGLLDARISWSIDSLDLDVALFGKNLTDEVYRATAFNAQSIGWNFVVLGEPRTYGIQARKSF